MAGALQALLEDLEHEIHLLGRGVLPHEADAEDLAGGRTQAARYLHFVSETKEYVCGCNKLAPSLDYFFCTALPGYRIARFATPFL